MKYLYKTSKGTLINMNRSALERKLGRTRNSDDTTEFLCAMREDENGAELHVLPEDEQYFTATALAQMTDVQQIPDPVIPE